jgi:hypothetical protein
MTDEDLKEGFNKVCDGILSSTKKELDAIKDPKDLEQFWFYKTMIRDIEKPSLATKMYHFFDALQLYETKCEQWEENNSGYVCVVERVRDKYLMPKIKWFISEEIENAK